MIEIDTGDVAALPARFARSEKAIDAKVGQAVGTITEGVLRSARQRVPKRSGAARASLRMGAGDTRTLTGGNYRAKYYGWLDFGGRTGIRRSVHRVYWFACVLQAAATIRPTIRVSTLDNRGIGVAGSLSLRANTVAYVRNAVAGALPTPAAPATTASDAPYIAYKVA